MLYEFTFRRFFDEVYSADVQRYSNDFSDLEDKNSNQPNGFAEKLLRSVSNKNNNENNKNTESMDSLRESVSTESNSNNENMDCEHGCNVNYDYYLSQKANTANHHQTERKIQLKETTNTNNSSANNHSFYMANIINGFSHRGAANLDKTLLAEHEPEGVFI